MRWGQEDISISTMDMQALHTMCSTPKRLGVRAKDYIKHPILLGEVTIILCMCLHSKLHIITHVATKVHVILGRNHIGGRQVELWHVTGRGPCLLAPLAANGMVVLLSWQGLTPLASTRGRRLYSYPLATGPCQILSRLAPTLSDLPSVVAAGFITILKSHSNSRGVCQCRLVG